VPPCKVRRPSWPTAVQRVKGAFNVVQEPPLRDGYRFEQTVDRSKTEDTNAAQLAFAEKRKPVYKGR